MTAAARMSLNRVCNLEDFRDPQVRATIREVFAHEASSYAGFPEGREHRKHWEVAMAVMALRAAGAVCADSQILGIGAGSEPTLFWLTNHAGRVYATDRYLTPDVWRSEASAYMLTDPGRFWPGPWRRQRLVVQHMDARELEYEDGSFDALFSSSSIEHFGSLEDISQAMDEAWRVLRPGGLFTLSTEFLIEGDPLAHEACAMFTPQLLREMVIGGRDWKELTPFDLHVSQGTLATEVPIARVAEEYALHRSEHEGVTVLHELQLSKYPHIVQRWGSNVFTSVHLALIKGPGGTRTRSWLGPSRIVTAQPRPRLRELAVRLSSPLTVVDAGCRWGFANRWEELSPNTRLIGFEPDPEEFERLSKAYASRREVRVVGVALGSAAGSLRLRVVREPGSESFYPLDPLLDVFDLPESAGEVVRELEVPVTTLDMWCGENEVDRVDVLKLDVQGHELEILNGAHEVLRSARAVEVEVCFNPLFERAPLFGDVDSLLRQSGFVLWRLRDLAHYPLRGARGAPGSREFSHYHGFSPVEFSSPPGILSWANAHYVRKEMLLSEAGDTSDEALRDAVIANALCFHDLSTLALRRLANGGANDALARQVTTLLKVAPIGDDVLDADFADARLTLRPIRRLLPTARQDARYVLRGARGFGRRAVARVSRFALRDLNRRLDQLEQAVVDSNAYVARTLDELVSGEARSDRGSAPDR